MDPTYTKSLASLNAVVQKIASGRSRSLAIYGYDKLEADLKPINKSLCDILAEFTASSVLENQVTSLRVSPSYGHASPISLSPINSLLTKLTSLRHISLSEWFYLPELSLSVSNLSNLTSLEINCCDTTSLDCSSLPPSLRKLEVLGTPLHDTSFSLSSTSQLTNLRFLELSASSESPFGITLTHLNLSPFIALETLSISDITPHCSIRSIDLLSNPLLTSFHIKAITLQSLNIKHTTQLIEISIDGFSGHSLPPISSPSLTSLSIYSEKGSHKWPQGIVDCTRLVALHLNLHSSTQRYLHHKASASTSALAGLSPSPISSTSSRSSSSPTAPPPAIEYEVLSPSLCSTLTNLCIYMGSLKRLPAELTKLTVLKTMRVASNSLDTLPENFELWSMGRRPFQFIAPLRFLPISTYCYSSVQLWNTSNILTRNELISFQTSPPFFDVPAHKVPSLHELVANKILELDIEIATGILPVDQVNYLINAPFLCDCGFCRGLSFVGEPFRAVRFDDEDTSSKPIPYALNIARSCAARYKRAVLTHSGIPPVRAIAVKYLPLEELARWDVKDLAAYARHILKTDLKRRSADSRERDDWMRCIQRELEKQAKATHGSSATIAQGEATLLTNKSSAHI